MIGKWILVGGVVLIAVGAVVWLVESLGLPLGRLPGDIRLRGEGWSFHFPVVTCIVISVVLTVVLGEIGGCLRTGGKLLVAEPKIHVPGTAFAGTVALAGEVGLKVVEEPKVRGCWAVVFEKIAT